MDDTVVLVMTSDKYIDAVRPFMHLFRKYWRNATPNMEVPELQKVVIAGFAPPSFLPELGKGVKFDSLGKFEDFPIGKWSDSLILALNRIQEEFVILMLEDYWLIHPVNLMCVYHAREYMNNNPSIIKFDLAGDRRYAKDANLTYDRFRSLEIILSEPKSPYHFSLMTGLWRKSHLLSVLRPGWSPWDIELEGTPVLANRKDLKVVGSHQWPVQHTLAFRGGDVKKLLLSELKVQDQNELRGLGYFKPWEN